MIKKTLVIDGNNFSNLSTFYDEVEKALTSNSVIGRNLDAFNDILRGGFGKFEYDEPIIIKWANSGKSRTDLSWDETIHYIESKLERCHPSNKESVKKELELSKKKEGLTIFDIILEIIAENDHVTLELC
jgi:RNAse (barnase) inhibitor barstar